MLSQLTYQIEIGGGFDAPALRELRLEEALDRPYELSLLLDVADADEETSQWAGQSVVVTIDRGAVRRRVCGVIHRADEPEPRADGTAGATVRAIVVPGLSFLALRRNTRMFQSRSVPDILEAVLSGGLGDYDRGVRLELNRDYVAREYCLQYQESDLGFVSRLMEEEGITYTFDHEGDVEVMVLRDDNASAEEVLAAPAPGVVTFSPDALEVGASEPIHRFERDLGTTTTAAAVRDFDWTSGAVVVRAEQPGEDGLGRARESYEHGVGRSLTITSYDQGVRRYQAQDSAPQAQIRAEAHAVSAVVARGIGRVVNFAPGVRFRLNGHPGVGLDGDYLVTRVVHQSEEAVELRRQGGSEPYHNAFECIPLSTPYRPERRTSKPRVWATQTAVVTGPPGEEIHTDEWGRVKVQFHWDRENPADDSSSTWLRCRQEWTGPGWGWLWTPRIGHEVVVQFIDGDPDRPLVFGSLYNANHPLPYDLPGEKTKSTLKSNSSIGGGFNEIRFEDAAGSEEFFFHSQKDTNEVILNNETISIGANHTVDIGVNQTQTIGANQTETVGANQSLKVGANRVIDVGASFTETIAGSSTITVGGHATETLNAGETQTVNGGRTETVNGGETRTVNGGQTETLNGGLTQTVNGGVTQSVSAAVTEAFSGAHVNVTTGSLTHTIGASATVTTPAAYTVVASAGYDNFGLGHQLIFAAGGYTVVAGGGMTWAAPIYAHLTGIDTEQSGTHHQRDLVRLMLSGIRARAEGTGEADAEHKLRLRGLDLEVHGVKMKATTIFIELIGLNVSISGVKACT